MSVVRIMRESPYYRVFFLKKIYENFAGTLKTVRNRGVRTGRFDCTFLDLNPKFLKINCAAWKNDSRLKKSDFAKEISQLLHRLFKILVLVHIRAKIPVMQII